MVLKCTMPSQEMAILMLWLLEHSSVVKYKRDGSHDKLQPTVHVRVCVSGLPMTHRLRVFGALDLKFTLARFVLCMELTIQIC